MGDIGGLALDASQLALAGRMVRAVRADGQPQRAAVVVLETAIVESALRVYANPNVPESMGIVHDLVGSDHASVGPLQQQVPSWGSAADCMDPVKSALKFLHGAGNNPGLLNLPTYRFRYVGYPRATNWQQIPTGDAAQAVQVSAFPTRYQQMEATAQAIVAAYWHTDQPAPHVTIPEDDDMPVIYTDATQSRVPLLFTGGTGIRVQDSATITNARKAGAVVIALGNHDYIRYYNKAA